MNHEKFYPPFCSIEMLSFTNLCDSDSNHAQTENFQIVIDRVYAFFYKYYHPPHTQLKNYIAETYAQTSMLIHKEFFSSKLNISHKYISQ